MIRVETATPADRPVLERLWQLFRHDMSEFTAAVPDVDGRFRSERLDSALNDAGWRAYLISLDSSPVGLAVVRGLEAEAEARVMSGFFVVRGARGQGVALSAAAQILRRHPGKWMVAFQDANTAAARFWRRVASESAGGEWTMEHRDVPGRPDLAPDSWISLTSAD